MNLPSTPVWATRETARGWLAIRLTAGGVSHVVLPCETEALTLQALGEENLRSARRDQAAADPWLDALTSWLQGQPTDLNDWPLDLSGTTDFQRRVWKAAQDIPWGQTRSYFWIATRLGDPRAARAVGSALGANPIPLAIPCHRVVREDGGLGGFTGGLPLKRFLLEAEGALSPEPALPLA